jgi:hypothetical protein
MEETRKLSTHRQIKEIFGADKGRKGVIDFSARDAACHEVQKKVPAPDAEAPTDRRSAKFVTLPICMRLPPLSRFSNGTKVEK